MSSVSNTRQFVSVRDTVRRAALYLVESAVIVYSDAAAGLMSGLIESLFGHRLAGDVLGSSTQLSPATPGST